MNIRAELQKARDRADNAIDRIKNELHIRELEIQKACVHEWTYQGETYHGSHSEFYECAICELHDAVKDRSELKKVGR